MTGVEALTAIDSTFVHRVSSEQLPASKLIHTGNVKVKQLLICRLLALFVMVLNAHSQALFVAADPTAMYTVLVYASVSCIPGSIALACLFVHIFQEQLGDQLTPFGYKGKVFYSFIFISLVPDFLGLLLTCLLAHRLQYNKYAYTSNLLPAGLSILNTLINACA